MRDIAIFAGTFDPITLGHVDLVQRSLKHLSQLIIAVSPANSQKSPKFTFETRFKMVEATFKEISSIKVVPLQGLLVDMARQYHASVILRGLRSINDFTYEYELAGMNSELDPTIDTYFLMCHPKLSHISSSLVRGIISVKGDISAFAPRAVIQFLTRSES